MPTARPDFHRCDGSVTNRFCRREVRTSPLCCCCTGAHSLSLGELSGAAGIGAPELPLPGSNAFSDRLYLYGAWSRTPASSQRGGHQPASAGSVVHRTTRSERTRGDDGSKYAPPDSHPDPETVLVQLGSSTRRCLGLSLR